MKRVTLRQINEALAKVGPERLVRGEGYFYFIEGHSVCWHSASVYVSRLSDMTVEQWVHERNWRVKAWDEENA